MDYETLIEQFKEYARERIAEHSAAIKAKYQSETLATDVRLQVFNQHLDDLKLQLQGKVNEITAQNAHTDAQTLQGKLQSSYNVYINGFYKMEF